MDPQLADVLVDAGCPLQRERVVQSFHPRLLNVLATDFRPGRGAVLLLGTRVADGRDSESTLRDIRRRFPSITIYVCAVGDSPILARIVRYARAGADEIFDIQTPSDLAHMVTVVQARTLVPVPADEMDLIAERFRSCPERRLLLHSLRNAFHPRPVAAVFRPFGYAARTVAERFRKADLPTPEDLLRVGRYLHLMELNRHGIASLRVVAQRLGFADADGVRQWVWKLRRSTTQKPRLSRFMELVPSLSHLVHDGGDLDT